jgi:hypothetical protein
MQKFLVWALPLLVVTLLIVVGGVYGKYIAVKNIPCWFRLLTGYLCAGCGGTRSFYALMRGDILSSVKYNAFVPCMALVGVVLYVRLFLKVVCGRDIQVLPSSGKWVYTSLVVWLAYTVLRNIL